VSVKIRNLLVLPETCTRAGTAGFVFRFFNEILSKFTPLLENLFLNTPYFEYDFHKIEGSKIEVAIGSNDFTRVK